MAGLAAVAACGAPAPPAPPDAASVSGDFAARCAGPGVVRCTAFDADAEIAGHVQLAGDDAVHAAIDTEVAATGAGSLRFDLPPRSSANAAGAVWLPVAEDPAIQFGEHTVLYVQWRQRFAPGMLRAFATTGPPAGWHQLGVGQGDVAGQWPSVSCSELEIVIEQDPGRGAPAGHHDCLTETALPAAAVPYVADTWLTFQLEVEVGTWNTPTSHIRLWFARPGEPQAVVIDAPGFTLDYHPGPDTGTLAGARLGKLWIEPFVDGKDPTEDHPTATTWYDDLIVARQRVGDPVP